MNFMSLNLWTASLLAHIIMSWVEEWGPPKSLTWAQYSGYFQKWRNEVSDTKNESIFMFFICKSSPSVALAQDWTWDIIVGQTSDPTSHSILPVQQVVH